MPRHPDAIGYLSDLAKEINEPWFRVICDLVVSGVSNMDRLTLDSLFAIYTGKASYIGINAASGIAAAAAQVVPADFLEQLSGFMHFKRLVDSLYMNFEKRVTLIFGANGSGKSSVCESLKVLADPAQPARPLENARAIGNATPTFRFKFRSDPAPQTWTHAVGYGTRRATVKFFDAAVAVQNVTNAVEPGRVILLAPFKLDVFERTKALTVKFRESIQRVQQENSLKLTNALQTIRSSFANFKNRPLATIADETVSALSAEIKLGEDFKDHKLLGEKQAATSELEKATSEEGLKLLRAEHRELEFLLTSVNSLLLSAETLWALAPAKKARMLSEKSAAQEVLAKTLIPDGASLDDLLALLRAASLICKMDDATGRECPLCKRPLGISEGDLFRQYHALLIGNLEKEISAIKADLTRAAETAYAIGQVDSKAWDKCKTVPEEIRSAVTTNSELIIANCDVSKEPTAEAEDALVSLKAAIINWETQLDSKMSAIEIVENGRDELLKQLTILRAELDPLEYANAIALGLEGLKAAQAMSADLQLWDTKIPAFTQALKRVTEKAKDAHEDLIVADFEARLDAEYKALAEKDMSTFGVKFARKGADAAVTVLPHVGGKGIKGVLSEGEQRLHALALFFAELETCAHTVLVFDDPISSFDYNYIANYCARLRDFSIKFRDRQIIVLTHNWEFFVQLQMTMNQAGLDSYLSIYVLENCAVIANYSEKIDDLKSDINAILSHPGEPTKPGKEELAGKMRRLIEAVVNSYVFNHQRHQYKQKSQAITAFQSFTKIVALLPAEATTLRDLYGKLSITEHDDPRAAYVNTDKAVFHNRYNQILAIETAIKSRMPP